MLVRGNGQNKKPCSNEKLVNLYAKDGEEIPIDDNKLKENLRNIINWFWNNYNEYTRK